MAKIKSVPDYGYDILLHGEDNENEVAIFPYTRYKNILHAPNVVKDASAKLGAPFHLLQTSEEEMTLDDIRALTDYTFKIL